MRAVLSCGCALGRNCHRSRQFSEVVRSCDGWNLRDSDLLPTTGGGRWALIGPLRGTLVWCFTFTASGSLLTWPDFDFDFDFDFYFYGYAVTLQYCCSIRSVYGRCAFAQSGGSAIR